MALTKLTGINEIATCSVLHGTAVGYVGTNLGNLYQAVAATGVLTLLTNVGAKIVSMVLNHPTLYLTTSKGEIFSYDISTTLDPYTGTTVGANANVIGSGVILNRTTMTAAQRLYTDDGGAVLWGTGSVPDIKGSITRTLISINQTGGHIRVHALMGQLKSQDGYWNTEVVSAVHGRMEIVRSAATLVLGGYGVSASVMGVVATSGAITVNTYHVLAGVAAIADFRATLTQTGKTVGLFVGKYDTTNWSDSTARTVWGYGLYIPTGATGQAAIQLGDKASSPGSGIVVNAAPADGSGIAGILKVYGDLGGVVPGNTVDINAVESRFLVATDCSASTCSIKAMRGHLRMVGGKLPTGSNAGLIGYLEIDGTSVIGTGTNAAVMAMIDATGGAVSGAANSVLSAFCVQSTGSFGLTTARSTIMHLPFTGVTSLFDIGAASGFVTASQLTGGTSLYLTVYIANKAYTITCTTTS